MRTYKTLAAASFMLVLLAACGSSGIGDILGGGSNSGASNYEIRGTVDSVDANSRSIYLTNVSGYSNMLSNGGGSNVRVYYDERTPVTHQGSTYRPEDLERGDVISVRVDEDGNRLIANTMTVVSDSSSGTGGSTYPNSGSGVYGSNVRGTVRYIDMNRRTIEVDTGSVNPVVVEFDTSTPVYFGNSTYRPADLERGDEIDVRLNTSSGSRYVARDITVTRNISDNGAITGSQQTSTIRGTVRYIDTSRRTIELESANWISGFNSGAGTGSSVMTLGYDNNTQIDVNGSWQAITGLERGDVIEVQVRNTGGSTYYIDRAFLVRNVRN
jgi:predicted RNA-binding protein